MRFQLKAFVILCFSVVLVLACQRFELGPKWKVDALVPVLKTSFVLEDLIRSRYLQTDQGGDLEIRYEDVIFDFELEELFQLPDTTTVTTNQGSFIPIQIAPGQSWVADTSQNRFNISDLELLEMEIESGQIGFEIESTVLAPMNITYVIPPARKGGQPLVYRDQVPTATSTTNSFISGSIDLSGYLFDLRGRYANDFNTVYFLIDVQLDSNSAPYMLTSNDVITTRVSYTGILPKYVRGNFLRQVQNEADELQDFSLFDNLNSGILDVEEVKLDFEVRNSLGVDIRARIRELSGLDSDGNKTELTGEIIGRDINLDRATIFGTNDPPVYTQHKQFSISTANSNVDELLESRPEGLFYDIDLEINPLGTVSGGNDFIYRQTGIDIFLAAEIPLCLRAGNLLFRDTSEVQIADSIPDPNAERINGGELILQCNNDFGFDLMAKLYLLNESMEVIDSLFTEDRILGAALDSLGYSEQASETVARFSFGEETSTRIYETEAVQIDILLDGPEAPNFSRIRATDSLRMTLSADFEYDFGKGD
jgi:hypothetical protein